MSKPKILLIDDNEAFLELFLSLEGAQGFDIVPLTSAKKALEVLNKEPVDLIISDVQMPEMSGTELFSRVQDLYPDIPVILITAFGSTEGAIQAVKRGAFHYFEKPINDKLDLFWITVREALAKREILKELASLRRERSLQIKTPVTIIGQSEGIKKVARSIEEVADLPVTVLICGETGTGKELVARAIHNLSDRRDKPFFAVSCNEFALGVLESELFGHEKGAFTGAIDRKIGLFEVAHKGILFLDEISEAPPFFQSKLLRIVETKTFMRVGGIYPIYSDFRLLVATNRNLEAEVACGRFRQDLFYRLNVYTIEILPLRDRKEDIPLIAEFYLKRFSEAYRRPITGISTNAMLSLREYDWPGNVRELINVIERAVITCQDNMITTKHLPFGKGEYEKISDLDLRDVERFFIGLALRRTKNNKTKAADLLGISRKTLIEKIKNYELDETTEN
ncbi:MAG: sigma-54-dependent Fis family transcriptional regulator [Deltaproteobacteria bacterium]|nr:sigma-54-dependent Fis family transcriptional regulator [Deltaproteobacteria bacterium]MBW2073823.1 sigma-54-dependent Fis family transcriptional regulator [Deltaproteobacteria bacterium]